jgi:predicted phage terminase large subunit-like protein
MVGDTDVLMADGSTTKLRDIRPGNLVATYEGGRISTSKVVNHQSNGVDAVFTVQTQSGRILRANERHPFLVEIGGERKWIRLKDLKVGMELVATKVATGHQGLKQSLDFAGHAPLKSPITEKTQTPHIVLWGIMESGRDWFAKAAKVFRQKQRVYAAVAIQSDIRQENQLHLRAEQGGLKAAMALRLSSMKAWLLNAITNAISAVSSLANKTLAHIGMASSALTIATKQEKSGVFSATNVTLQLDTESLQASCVMPLNTYSVTTDAIVKISPDRYEEVFDVQIDRTENFIANGVVSHNTRWHQRDLTGRVLKSSIERGGTDEWEVIELPAILPSGNALWPEFWSLKELEAIKAELSVSKWSAQYQQNPTSEEGAIVKRDWWRVWEREDPPPCDFLIQSWDTAFTKKQTSDFSACTTWGVFRYPNPETGVTQNNIILLDAVKERMEFPELKRKAYEMYMEYNPDAFIVEAKAAGAPLIYELRAMGIPVSEFTPSRGNDKVARVNAVSDLFSSGIVWAPQTRWAEEVVEEFASFPNAEHDDLVDSSTQALLRFRQGGFVSIETDEPMESLPRRRINYY